VFLKISSAIVPQSQAKDYLAYLQTTILPRYRSAPGLVSVQLLRRPVVAYVEVLTLSTWQTEDSLKGFAEIEPAIDRRGFGYGTILLDARIYEVAGSEKGG
jgi:heme-degrading monooxygenase HmoA